MAFRFFINVDQCLNMHNFDFFFYKKQSLCEFHLTPDVSIGDGTGLSFHKAASDIRSYLDRFAYNVGDYQIIIAMRNDYQKNVEVWRDTLLSRLLDIDFELRQSNILIRSGLGVQIAVNLIMLYETNKVTEIHAVDEQYMGSSRLVEDCRMLLDEIGVPKEKENDLESIKEAWKQYVDSHSDMFSRCQKTGDGSPAHSLYCFFADLIKQYEKDQIKEYSSSTKVSTLQALKEVLSGYQIFELLTDKQNRNKDINTLLRVVEFATEDFDVPVGMNSSVSLTELCSSHWKKIVGMDEYEIQKKYSKLLCEYKERLSTYVSNNEEGYVASDTESTLPQTIIPSDNDICVTDSVFEDESSKRSTKNNPKSIIESFKSKLSPVNTLFGRWESTYKQVRRIFGQLENNLEEYASLLGEMYSENLVKRKNEERTWNKKAFVEDCSTGKEIEQLTSLRKDLLVKLDQPQMTPSLRFQDQLNMETALEQEDQNIRHYIKCMQSLTAKGFLLLIILLAGLVALLYGLLQPYNFEAATTAIYYLAYMGLAFGLMLLSWRLPINYYKRKVLICLTNLEQEMDKYITGYFDRAKQLHEYINLINQLDYAERHLQLKQRAVKTTEWVIDARKWHLVQAKIHLEKLEFFSGLIGTYKAPQALDDSSQKLIEDGPIISRDHVDDVIDNKLYWPQG